MITRNPSLTEQVMAHLRERILAGDFEEGRIPPETELATELGVSRTTIRDAFSRLEHQGIITRRQGAGTFVNEPGLQIKSRLEEIWSYDEVLRDHGYTPSIDLLGTTTEPADSEIAADLGVDEGEPVVVMEKLFRENDRPVIHTSNRVAASLVDDPDGIGAALPIYEFLDQHCGRLLGYYLSEIVPVTLDARVAGLLDVAAGTPALCFQEVGFDQDNQAVLSARSVFRDDLLRFRLIRRKAGV